jgi:fatty acyl-CoA reductase
MIMIKTYINIIFLFLLHIYSFDDLNSEKLQMAVRDSAADADLFCFDPKCVDWEDYMINVHFPGVVKYVFK